MSIYQSIGVNVCDTSNEFQFAADEGNQWTMSTYLRIKFDNIKASGPIPQSEAEYDYYYHTIVGGCIDCSNLPMCLFITA